MRTLREERGGILALSAIVIPVFLLLTALVLDVGRWYTHKRALQNRADAGALAAGVEYLSQLPNCATSPGPAAAAIVSAARRYAGAGPGGYNESVNDQSRITVKINATSPTDSDAGDGGTPCEPHADGGVWTDVLVREANIGTVAGTFGLSLPSITARARVELNQITGLTRGQPFVTETGDTIDCVWAEFVRARDGSSDGFAITPPNPVPLSRAAPDAPWTASIENLEFTNSQDDVAIRLYAGNAGEDGVCEFSTDAKRPLPHDVATARQPVAVDWINVYSTGQRPGAGAPPVLRHFALTSTTCGGPGFLYTQSIDPNAECRVGFSAEIDTGQNNVRGTITVEPTQPSGSGIPSVTRSFNTRGGRPNLQTVTGTIVIHPNATTTANGLAQDYTQVGQTFFSVSWRQTTGTIGGRPCASTGCSGVFEGETVPGAADDVQQATYVADPLGSMPMTGSSTTLATTSFPALGSTGPFTISFANTALDQEHVVPVSDTGPGWDAVWCGGGGLGSAITGGCPKLLAVNTRSGSCAPPPSGGAIDCVAPAVDTTALPTGIGTRFSCTPMNWTPTGNLPPDGDPRWIYVPTTAFGRLDGPSSGWMPVEGFARIYVTGWGGEGVTGAPCGLNDPPPRGFDARAAQIWGHVVDPITLDTSVVTGDAPCNTDLEVVQCKPALVR